METSLIQTEDMPVRCAVSLVERDGHILVIHSRKFKGWVLPDGIVENGETLEQAQRRSLAAWCGLVTDTAESCYSGAFSTPWNWPSEMQSKSQMTVFRVYAPGLPKELVEGCPLWFMTKQEFLSRTPLKKFYTKVLESLTDVGDFHDIRMRAKESGRILYAVTFERLVGREWVKEIVHLHARTQEEARKIFLESELPTAKLHIGAIAPAIGMHVLDDKGLKLSV